MESRRLSLPDVVCFLVVLLCAAGARFWYLADQAGWATGNGSVRVQGCDREERDQLVKNLKAHRWFGSFAPLSDVEERTAHVSPGYPWLLSLAAQTTDDWQPFVRWVQAALGAFTAGFYFLIARRGFRSLVVGLVAGLFCAFYPFWVANCAEVCDGTLAAFLLAACLLLGMHAGQVGGPTASLLFGFGLAALSLVRAALLPFAVVAMLWFLMRCRWLKRGWLFAVLAFLGFVNGLVPWTLRNFQAYGDVVPIVDSIYLHLWIGNNPEADGGSIDSVKFPGQLARNLDHLRRAPNEGAAPNPEVAKVIAEWKKNPQNERYNFLADVVVKNIHDDPVRFVRGRISSGLCFVFGSRWVAPESYLHRGRIRQSRRTFGGDYLGLSGFILAATLFAMLLLAVLGWRWTYPFQKTSMPLSLALVWIPLPYILSHAEALSGPRLPLDGVLLCYAAFALACLIPGFGRDLFRGPNLKAE
jgi:4-amino-4-deoxy-L-arabinose transferase-like glycosyltransferase